MIERDDETGDRGRSQKGVRGEVRIGPCSRERPLAYGGSVCRGAYPFRDGVSSSEINQPSIPSSMQVAPEGV